jgi:hypothetical protein
MRIGGVVGCGGALHPMGPHHKTRIDGWMDGWMDGSVMID